MAQPVMWILDKSNGQSDTDGIGSSGAPTTERKMNENSDTRPIGHRSEYTHIRWYLRDEEG